MQVHVSRFIAVVVMFSGLMFSQGPAAEEAQEESAAKVRTVVTRDPRTGRTITQQVPISDGNEVPAGSGMNYRTIQTRDPRTGRTITQRVPLDGEAQIKLHVRRFRERHEFPDEQWQQIEPLLTTVMELQLALTPSANFRNRAMSTGVMTPGQGRGDMIMRGAEPEDVGNPNEQLRAAFDSLLEAARHPEATDEEIAQKMQAYTQKRQEAETELQAAKLQLTELLSTRQRAQLMLEGVL